MVTRKKLCLLAAEPLPCGNWLHKIYQTLLSMNMSVQSKHNTLIVWKTTNEKNSISYADCHIVCRLWLAYGRNALAIHNRRVYFIKDSREIDNRPEYEILGGKEIPHLLASEQIESQWQLLKSIIVGLNDHRIQPVSINSIESNLIDCREVHINSYKRISNLSLKSVYKELGFDAVPQKLTFSICPLEGVLDYVAQHFEKQLKKKFYETGKYAVETTISCVDKIEKFLKKKTIKIPSGWCAFFILPSKNKYPSAQTRSLFARLEKEGVPFRRAFSDDPVQHSIPEQLPSLLMAAGGIPHRSPTSAAGRSAWTIGIDVGHPKNNSNSTLALSLIDPNGLLSGAWTISHPRDETINSNCLQNLLNHCAEHLNHKEKNACVVVMRDGRPFKHENPILYSETLKCRVTFLEYRKRNNPQLVVYDDKPVAINEPFAAIVPGCNTMFLISQPSRNQTTLPRITKIHWENRYNGLNLEPEDIAQLIIASSAAPSLGCQPHIDPAAIYWADGIAGMDNIDTKFRGVKVKRL